MSMVLFKQPSGHEVVINPAHVMAVTIAVTGPQNGAGPKQIVVGQSAIISIGGITNIVEASVTEVYGKLRKAERNETMFAVPED